MKNKKEEIYIVKFGNKGVSDDRCVRYNTVYHTFAVIRTDNSDINKVIEGFRLQEQSALQEANKFKIETKVVSIKKILVHQILVTKA